MSYMLPWSVPPTLMCGPCMVPCLRVCPPTLNLPCVGCFGLLTSDPWLISMRACHVPGWSVLQAAAPWPCLESQVRSAL